jgi:hypothetical protein
MRRQLGAVTGLAFSTQCCDGVGHNDSCAFLCYHQQPEAQCPAIASRRRQCDCGDSGYTGEHCGTKRAVIPPAAGVTSTWQTVCIVVTACGSLALLCYVPHFQRTLRSLNPRLSLPDNDREQSYGGAFLFLCGIGDLLLSVKTCYELFSCDKLEGSLVLALCFLAALLVNYAATTFLAFHTLSTIRETRRHNRRNHPPPPPPPLRDDGSDRPSAGSLQSDADSVAVTAASSTTEVALRFPRMLPILILGAIPRFQSLAMLRLRLCNVEVFRYPMEDRHMFFLRNAVRICIDCALSDSSRLPLLYLNLPTCHFADGCCVCVCCAGRASRVCCGSTRGGDQPGADQINCRRDTTLRR